ncbi:LLM class flavin-dependent oxidoreductase [Rhodobacter sp. Har01]|uniref:LLM class flavin-dependent oxidoreductase n=1 Tax=Rhodobacter sp. Har01 TaxID=2883999 RepID=UPI001D06AF23|nr:LLM class flavin-dependent oxidoreductase [Rhodobacter sp. Har01]MCB6178245.1 LLM class flavin-dependent oxidoreductase [Rhodobacter sp. Har01]
MDCVHFLSTHLLDPAKGGKQLYADTVAQAVQAEACGYRGVAIPEHHLVNILLVPSPLQMAVKIAAHTRRLALMTSICQLPLRDMRIFAGEVIQAQALCEGRLSLGVGKGAFGYETARCGVPMDETKARFEDALALLEALLTRPEVGWDSPWYRFDPLTVMPRPEDPIPLMLGVMAPPGIEAAAAKNYHVQTTPLSATHGVLESQVAAFHRGRAQHPAPTNRLSLQRGVFLVRSEAERRRMVDLAQRYYMSFDNVFGGPGIVDHGVIRPLPRAQTAEELGANILICEKDQMIDRLAAYAEMGIDEVIVTSIFGQPQDETLEMMARFGAEVMPHLLALKRKAA